MTLMAVYVTPNLPHPPPQINATLILGKLREAITNYLMGLGDFNQTGTRAVMPKLHKNMNFPMRESSIVDLAYTKYQEHSR